jgi:hypothetical protein
MTDNAEIRNPEYTETFKLYCRARSRHSKNYKKLVKRIGRDPDVVWPDGWYDMDSDRRIIGDYGVYFGEQEFKHIDNLNQPLEWNEHQQKDVTSLLIRDNFKIDTYTSNFTNPGNIGIESDWNAMPNDGQEYSDYLRGVKRTSLGNGKAGKGVFLFVFYTHNLAYFAPINFTGSRHIFGTDNEGNHMGISRNKLMSLLGVAGNRLQPCFTEYLLFLVEAYIRQDFDMLYGYLLDGERKDLIRYTEANYWEQEISNSFIENIEALSKYDAVVHVMQWIMECIHFDTIIDNPKRYNEFVNLVRTGKIADCIYDIIEERTSIVQRTYERGFRYSDNQEHIL